MNIAIAAVGGQGAIFASKVIGCVALDNAYDVKVSEIKGMSQRGGSVVTFIRFSDKVASPVVEEGTADILLAFELLESARYIRFVKPGGVVIVNNQEILPLTATSAKNLYQSTIIESLQKLDIRLVLVDAINYAEIAGNRLSVNAVMLGVFAKCTSFTYDSWIKCIRELSPLKFVDTNVTAFDLGYEQNIS